MTSEIVLARVERHLRDLNARQARMGLPALEDADLTWHQRAHEIAMRLLHMHTDDRPNVDLMDTAAAHIVAAIVAAERAENARPETGSEKEAA